MIEMETPIEFYTKKNIENVEIEYSELLEINQGGPIVGNLFINGKKVEGLFGGPALYRDGYIYVPIFAKKFLGTGFRLVRINISNYKIEYLTKVKRVIFLDKIEMNHIYYFE